MAIIPQRSLFSWQDVDELGDLERLRIVLDYIPDEELMTILEKERGNGRNEYPIRPVWNSILAGIVFQHSSIESLRRELQRNAQLRELCGFDVLRGVDAVPPSWVYSRFLSNLMEHIDDLENMFRQLVESLKDEVPDFGQILAIDGKAIDSHAQDSGEGKEVEIDGRRDTDADWGVKEYRGQNEDGTSWAKTVTWFGYRLHLIVDAIYELPVAFDVTVASQSEVRKAHGLIGEMSETSPWILDRCDYLTGDRGYDDGKLINVIWDEHRIKPIIDIRNMWKDGQETRLIGDEINIVYDYEGTVYCHCLDTDIRREMAYGGYEQDRDALKYKCPARHYGIDCKCMGTCPVKTAIRIKRDEDPRVFTPVARSSYKWDGLYKTRTAVERVNSRIGEAFGFDKHFIRGLKKMKVRMTFALSVMLAMALGRIKENDGQDLRSLVKSA